MEIAALPAVYSATFGVCRAVAVGEDFKRCLLACQVSISDVGIPDRQGAHSPAVSPGQRLLQLPSLQPKAPLPEPLTLPTQPAHRHPPPYPTAQQFSSALFGQGAGGDNQLSSPCFSPSPSSAKWRMGCLSASEDILEGCCQSFLPTTEQPIHSHFFHSNINSTIKVKRTHCKFSSMLWSSRKRRYRQKALHMSVSQMGWNASH